MADRVLLFTWGTPVRGREERALEVFNESVGMYGRLQQEGRIESFDITLLEPNGYMNGYAQLHGSEDQINALHASEDFQRLIVDAELIVDDVRLIDGVTGAGIAEQIGIYQDAVAKVPQRA
jgi:hypothetical protein